MDQFRSTITIASNAIEMCEQSVQGLNALSSTIDVQHCYHLHHVIAVVVIDVVVIGWQKIHRNRGAEDTEKHFQ